MSDVYLVLFMAEAVCQDPLYLRKMAFYSLPETGHDLDFFFGSAQHEVYAKDSSSLNTILRICLRFQCTSLLHFTW